MTRFVLVLALVLPGIAHAEMWRWRDAGGGLHYSNVPSRVPSYASPVRTKLGQIGGEPIGPEVDVDEEAFFATPDEAAPAVGEAPSVVRRGEGVGCSPGNLWWLPHRSVDLDRPHWYWLDQWCGSHVRDVEAWLRNAATRLELRKIGLGS